VGPAIRAWCARTPSRFESGDMSPHSKREAAITQICVDSSNL
jgi:hypothetical protein